MAASDDLEAVRGLSTSDPTVYLSPSPEISGLARSACSSLYSALLPFCPRRPPLDHLLAGEGFDAEQVWSQIDLLAGPLLSSLRRNLQHLEKRSAQQKQQQQHQFADADADSDADAVEEPGDEEDLEDEEDEEEEEELEDEEEEELEDVEEEEGEGNGVEDKFLKIKELEEFLEKGEQEDYGVAPSNERRDEKNMRKDDEEEEEDDEDDALDLEDFSDDENGAEDKGEDARYEDFFGGNARKGLNRRSNKGENATKKVQFKDELEDTEMDNEQKDDEDRNEPNNVSTHEKELLKMRARVEQMEKANLEPKSWTMQGEVTAASRPKNSALEVDLDFEHNVRPAPVITEEVTASIEELIRKRIIEGHFDDVQKAPSLPLKAPKELKELDESKSKQGLAELYEEEYAHKKGLACTPLSVSDELKKEASTLFKQICLKLDALSHFHFAPKPVIEDMSIQINVPALAMEEIAPVAVSDVAMLAPEEIFEGKGDIKEEGELTQAERRRRRANKKRRFKAETAKREAKRARADANLNHKKGQVNSVNQ